jgi:translation initiation factor 2 subunit 1
MYKNKYPSVDDIVLVTIKKITDIGVYVSLLEYDNIEGMISISELSRKRIKSIKQVVTIGKTEVVVVIKIDEEKGYIDLSKKRVTLDEKDECTNNYAKSKTVHGIMQHISMKTDKDLISLYESFGWLLYDNYGHAYNALKLSINDSKIIDTLSIDDNVKTELLNITTKRFKLTSSKLEAKFECTSFIVGIDSIINALKAGKNQSTSEIELKINLISSPLYVISCTTFDSSEGVTIMNKALNEIKSCIEKDNGEFKLKTEPTIINKNDDLHENLDEYQDSMNEDSDSMNEDSDSMN